MSWRIRRFEERDYEPLARLNQVAGPGLHETAAELRYFDTHTCAEADDPRGRLVRYVAENGERLIGAAWYDRGIYHHAAGQCHFQIVVQPSWRGQGLGGELFEQLLTDSTQSMLTTRAAEDDGDTIRFLRRRGFEATAREQELELRLADFDPDIFRAEERRPFERQLRLVTLPELEDSPDAERQLCTLWLDDAADVPVADWMLRDYRLTVLEGPRVIPEGFFVALDAGQVVAVTNLERWACTDALEVGYTVVRPAYRQRGIALALKIRALRHAKECNCPTVCTTTDLSNERMLRINEHLGFQRTRVWAELHKSMGEAP